MSEAGRPRVLYVLGTQRGGTTLAGRLAGSLPGATFVGELRRLWEVAVPEGRRCGCGAGVESCPLWSAVLPRVASIGGPEEVRRWQQEAGPAETAASRTYGRVLATTYAAISEVTGSRVVVDSSKHPAEAQLLAAMGQVDLRVLHLLRDPRGTVHSRLRRHDGSHPRRAHPRLSVLEAAGWVARHRHSTAVRRLLPAPRSLTMSYEELVARPDEALAALARLAGLDPPPEPLVRAGGIDLPTAHTPTGDGRFVAQRLELRRDDRWVDGLGRADRWLVTAVAGPWARRYGYRFRSKLEP